MQYKLLNKKGDVIGESDEFYTIIDKRDDQLAIDAGYDAFTITLNGDPLTWLRKTDARWWECGCLTHYIIESRRGSCNRCKVFKGSDSKPATLEDIVYYDILPIDGVMNDHK